MEKTSRRNLLRAAAVGGAAASGLGVFLGSERAGAISAAAQNRGSGRDEDEHRHDDDDDDGPLSGRRAQATVSFGQWDANPANPLDRNPPGVVMNSPPGRNIHKALPFEVEIEAGGAVSFIISGAHQILIYEGLKLEDFPRPLAAPDPRVIPGPPGPGLVSIPEDRIYRGLNPFALNYATFSTSGGVTSVTPLANLDRVESVNFPTPGRYLVICGVLPHYNEGMHGFVKVRERD
jgi:plastocyanin